MATATYDALRWHVYEKTDDPEIRRRRSGIIDTILAGLPEKRAELEEEGVLQEARAALRKVLARRKLTLGAGDEARIDACTDRDTLERWFDQAFDAASVAEALR